MNYMTPVTTMTYRLETWPVFWRDSEALRHEHHADICADPQMQMKVNYDEYDALWRMGLLQVLVARDGDQMVGYFITVIRPHPHYNDTIIGHEDAHFLTKSHRRGFAGLRLIREAEGHLRAAGVHRMNVHTKSHKNKGRVFERLGFTQTDIIYSKRLDNPDGR